MFLAAAFVWAAFIVVMRVAKLDPLYATAMDSTCSLVVDPPVYIVVRGFKLFAVLLPDLARQVAF